jgi:hypothetical protein
MGQKPMNIEELSKAQLLLLTVLVNFVVSIATGILTVSLLDEAPANITQTIDRVVEHTVETISTPIQVATTAVKPTPEAPSGEQLLTTAISAAVNRTVLIHRGASTSSPAILYGTYLPKQRSVATVTGAATLPKEVTIVFANGGSAPASLSKSGGGIAIYGFSDAAALPNAPSANLVPYGDLKAGQTTIAITRDNSALTGIVSKLSEAGVSTSLTGIPPGAASVNLSGAVIGIQGLTPGLFIPTDSITALLTEAPAP